MGLFVIYFALNQGVRSLCWFSDVHCMSNELLSMAAWLTLEQFTNWIVYLTAVLLALPNCRNSIFGKR